MKSCVIIIRLFLFYVQPVKMKYFNEQETVLYYHICFVFPGCKSNNT